MTSYGYFHYPNSIKARALSDNISEFELSPLEKGFGHTVGNCLRRILLSSITSPALVSVRIDRFLHEFMAVEGIVEDMTNVAMNFKGVLIKFAEESEHTCGEIKEIEGSFELSETDLDAENGSISIRAGDIIVHKDIEVVNPEKVLFTCTSPQKLSFKIKFSSGRGYVPVDKSPLQGREEDGEVLLDGLFSPVKLVNCKIANSRVGSSTDYDKLILTVETDGRITPQNALLHAFQIGDHFFTNIKEVSDSKIEILGDAEEELQNSKAQEDEKILDILGKKIHEMDFTVRASNCLKDAGVLYFGELVLKDEADMLNIKNLGKKSLDELRSKIQDQGKENSVYMYFGMDLSKYGINKENARDFFENYTIQKQGVNNEAS